MLRSPLARLFVEPLDIALELILRNSPDSPAPDLDRRKVARSHQRVYLRNADLQIFGDVLIVLMTSALVVAIWGVARDRLVSIVSAALSTVCGSFGC